MRKHTNRKTWMIGVLITGVLFLIWQWYVPVTRTGSVMIEIRLGENLQSVLTELQEKNLIRNATLLGWYAKATNLDTDIKAGRFSILPHLSPARILQFLANPDEGEISITIPEGFSVYDIDKKLAKMNVIQAGEFVAWIKAQPAIPSLEGYLFPDTYFVFPGQTIEETISTLVGKMRANFDKKITTGLKDELAVSSRSLHEIITMASILEEEVRTIQDYPVVAGILWKRLNHKWPLQADSTLLYGKEDRTISSSDLQKKSPYNSYQNRGLPPTPIGNPGLITIRAALHPQESPYWFYLTTPDGTVIYSRTNEEQNANRRKYLP